MRLETLPPSTKESCRRAGLSRGSQPTAGKGLLPLLCAEEAPAHACRSEEHPGCCLWASPGRTCPRPVPAQDETATRIHMLTINKSPCKREPISLSL